MKEEKIRCRTVGDLIDALKGYPKSLPLSLYAHASAPGCENLEMHPIYDEESPCVEIFVRKINSWGIDALQIGNENGCDIEMRIGTLYDSGL